MEKKELSLVGKDNVVEKVIVKKDKSLFGKDFKVVFSFVRSSSVYPGPSTATGTHFRFNSTAVSHSTGFPHSTGPKIQDNKIDDYRAGSTWKETNPLIFTIYSIAIQYIARYHSVVILDARKNLCPKKRNEKYCLTFIEFIYRCVFFFFSLINVCFFVFSLSHLQATRCSFSGFLDSDPDSTVYISGCQPKKDMDITLMSKKVNAMKCISPF